MKKININTKTLSDVYKGDSAAMKSNVYVEDIVDHRFTSKYNKIKIADNHEVTNLIIDKCVEYGFNEKETLMAIAISKAEAGANYDSSACRNKNNVGGIMDWDNNWQTTRAFDTLDEGVDYYVKNLKKHMNNGLDTFAKLQPKYCPIGAENAPNGLNKNWLSNTTNFYNQLFNIMSA